MTTDDRTYHIIDDKANKPPAYLPADLVVIKWTDDPDYEMALIIACNFQHTSEVTGIFHASYSALTKSAGRIHIEHEQVVEVKQNLMDMLTLDKAATEFIATEEGK